MHYLTHVGAGELRVEALHGAAVHSKLYLPVRVDLIQGVAEGGFAQDELVLGLHGLNKLGPMLKPTRFLTNTPGIARELARLCPRDQIHVPLVGKALPMTGERRKSLSLLCCQAQPSTSRSCERLYAKDWPPRRETRR